MRNPVPLRFLISCSLLVAGLLTTAPARAAEPSSSPFSDGFLARLLPASPEMVGVIAAGEPAEELESSRRELMRRLREQVRVRSLVDCTDAETASLDDEHAVARCPRPLNVDAVLILRMRPGRAGLPRRLVVRSFTAAAEPLAVMSVDVDGTDAREGAFEWKPTIDPAAPRRPERDEYAFRMMGRTDLADEYVSNSRARGATIALGVAGMVAGPIAFLYGFAQDFRFGGHPETSGIEPPEEEGLTYGEITMAVGASVFVAGALTVVAAAAWDPLPGKLTDEDVDEMFVDYQARWKPRAPKLSFGAAATQDGGWLTVGGKF